MTRKVIIRACPPFLSFKPDLFFVWILFVCPDQPHDPLIMLETLPRRDDTILILWGRPLKTKTMPDIRLDITTAISIIKGLVSDEENRLRSVFGETCGLSVSSYPVSTCFLRVSVKVTILNIKIVAPVNFVSAVFPLKMSVHTHKVWLSLHHSPLHFSLSSTAQYYISIHLDKLSPNLNICYRVPLIVQSLFFSFFCFLFHCKRIVMYSINCEVFAMRVFS